MAVQYAKREHQGQLPVKFVRPPVNEVGLSVSFATATVLNPFDVRATHELFRDAYPGVQRVDSTSGNEFELGVGLPPLNIQPVNRWWFISADTANVLQVQENYVARNWRRTVGLGEAPSYPGFDELLMSFESALGTLAKKSEAEGLSLPEIRSCELMYDDIIPGLESGGAFQLSRMISFLKERPPRQEANWRCSWVEPIDVPETGLSGTLQVTILAAGIPSDDGQSLRPILRIVWKATALQTAASQIRAFFNAAHAHISARFGEIVSAEVKESWGVE